MPSAEEGLISRFLDSQVRRFSWATHPARQLEAVLSVLSGTTSRTQAWGTLISAICSGHWPDISKCLPSRTVSFANRLQGSWLFQSHRPLLQLLSIGSQYYRHCFVPFFAEEVASKRPSLAVTPSSTVWAGSRWHSPASFAWRRPTAQRYALPAKWPPPLDKTSRHQTQVLFAKAPMAWVQLSFCMGSHFVQPKIEWVVWSTYCIWFRIRQADRLLSVGFQVLLLILSAGSRTCSWFARNAWLFSPHVLSMRYELRCSVCISLLNK